MSKTWPAGALPEARRARKERRHTPGPATPRGVGWVGGRRTADVVAHKALVNLPSAEPRPAALRPAAVDVRPTEAAVRPGPGVRPPVREGDALSRVVVWVPGLELGAPAYMGIAMGLVV